jgi:hypothetical protein
MEGYRDDFKAERGGRESTMAAGKLDLSLVATPFEAKGAGGGAVCE